MLPVDIRILVSVLLCASQSQSGKVMLVKTSGDQTKSVFLNDQGVQVAGEKSLIMDIKACAEAVVQFAQTQQLTGGFFEVYLGSRDNSMSMVRFSGKKKKESVRGSPLDCKDFRTFWFSWEDEGTLHVGSGSVIGVREFLSLEVEEAVEIHYVVVYTGMGNEGEWRVLRDSRPEFVHPNRDGSTVIDVREDTPAHGVIYELKARDPDEDDITYHVIGQYSDVFGVSGTNLKILRRLDFENKQNYVVTISATDGKHEVRQSMMVSVVDLVDEVPVIGPPVMKTILEELPVGTPIGQLATVVDRDRGAKLKYSLRGRDSQYFNIDTKTGDVRMRKRLDRDKRNGRHVLDQLYLTVDDKIHLQEKKLQVSVIDINDNPPMFGKTIYRVTIKENMFKDMVVANLSCVDIDDGANSVFSLVVSSVKAQTAPIKTKPPNKPSSTTPTGPEDQTSKPTTSEPPSVSGASHPEHKSPTAPAITDGRSGKETTSRGREWEDSKSKEMKRSGFPHSDGSGSRSTHKRDHLDSSASHNTGGKDVVGRNVRSTNVDELRMTPHYFSDNKYDESYSRKNTQKYDSSRQATRNSEYNFKDDSVGSKERPRYDSDKWQEGHTRDKPNSERVREQSERQRGRWKPDYDKGEQKRHTGDEHHSRETDQQTRRNYPVHRNRPRNEHRRSRDYYYEYDNDLDQYTPYRRPRYDGYRRRRWHEDEVRGSGWAGDSESQKGPVKAPVPDNWADLLKHDEPYLGPRHEVEPKHLEDVLKPIKPGESITNAIKDDEPLNIITKADQDKIRKEMKSSVAASGDETRETTAHASDATTSMTMTTEAERFDSPTMPHANFSDSSVDVVESENKTSDYSENAGIDSGDFLEDDPLTTTPATVIDRDFRTNALGFLDDDSATKTISFETSTSAASMGDGFLFDGDEEEEDKDNEEDDEDEDIDFGDTQTGTTDFPFENEIGTTTTSQEDKTDREYGGTDDLDDLDDTYDYDTTPATETDSDAGNDGNSNDYDYDSFGDGTTYESSTVADKENSIGQKDPNDSNSNRSTNTSLSKDTDYDALYDKFAVSTEENPGSYGVTTESTIDNTVTKDTVSDINTNGVDSKDTDPSIQRVDNQDNNNNGSITRTKRSSLKKLFGGKFRRYLKKNRKLQKAKAALRVIGRMLTNSRRRNRRRNDRWERVIRKFLKEIARKKHLKSDASGGDLIRDILINRKYLNYNGRERMTNEIPMDQVYYSDPTQMIQATGDQDDYLAQKMGQKLIPEQQYIQSLFRHFNDRQRYSERRHKQRYPSSWRYIRPNIQREAEIDRQTSKFPYYMKPKEQTSSPNHNDKWVFGVKEASPLERHGFEPLKYETDEEGLSYDKQLKPHHHYTWPGSEDGTQQHLPPAEIPSSFVDRNDMKPDLQLDYFENANPFNRDRDIGSAPREYDSVPDNYNTRVPDNSHQISNNDAELGREEISAARLKVYEELGLEPNLENLDYDYVDDTDAESDTHQTDQNTPNGEQTPPKYRLPGRLGPSYSNVAQSHYLNQGVPYGPQQEMQGYRHSDEKGNPNVKGYNEINSNAKPLLIPGDGEEQQNSLEELSNAVDAKHYVGPPLSSLAKLHIEEVTSTDKIPMNDFVLVPKDAIAKSLEREADALGIQLQQGQPSINNDYKYHNKIGKRNRKSQEFGSYFENRQNVKINNLKRTPTGNGQISPKSFPQELADLAGEDNMINSSPHFPPVSAYSKRRFLDKLDQMIFNRNKDKLSAQSKQRTERVDEGQSRGTTSDTSNLKDFLGVIAGRNAKLKLKHKQEAIDGINGKKMDRVPNPETSHINTPSFLRHLTRFKTFVPENVNQGRRPTTRKIRVETHDSEPVSNTNTRVKTWVPSENLWGQRLKSSPTFSRRHLPKRDTAKMAKPMFEARGLSIWANSKTVDFDTMGEGDHTYTLTVLAIDRPEYGSPQTGTTMVLVQVLPVNEFTPEWTDPPVNDSGWFPSVLVRENVTLGTKLISLRATDRDGGEDGRITYTLAEVRAANGKSAVDSFAMEPSTGTLTNAVKLDRDPHTGGVTHYDLVITASDNGETPFSIQGRMRVTLVDVNDNPPKFVKLLYEAILPSEWTQLSSWKLQLAVMDHDRKAAFKFKIVKGDSSKFSIDENTGVMRVRGTPDKTLPYKVLTVSVSDGGTPELTSSAQVIIHTQKYSFEQVRAAIDARTKSSGPWVFKMLSGVFGFILLFMVIFYVTKKYGLCTSVVRPDMDKPDDDVNRSRVINIAPPPDVTNRADNSGIEHVDVRPRRQQHHGGVTSLQSVDEGQDGHAQESISSMRKSHRY